MVITQVVTMNAPEVMERVFRGFERTSPGSKASTLRALRAVSQLPTRPSILDLGCGYGAPTLILAEETRGLVTAVDVDGRLLDSLLSRATERGLQDHVRTVKASMSELDFRPGSFDLIWSEGSVYNVGFPEGIRLWKPLLKDGSALGISELCWLVDEPPEEALAFWADGYPGLTTVESNLSTLTEQGYEPQFHFTLPQADWWAFYEPLERRLEEIKTDNPSADLQGFVEMLEREISLFRSFPDAFGYVFFIAFRA